jgi:AraC-like DNA-binding protein
MASLPISAALTMAKESFGMPKPAHRGFRPYLHALLPRAAEAVCFRMHQGYNVRVSPRWGSGVEFTIADLHLFYVKDGRPIYWLDDEKVRLARGDVLFAGKGVRIRHGQDSAHPPWFISLRFDRYAPEATAPLPGPNGRAAGVLRPRHPERFEALFEQVYAALLADGDAADGQAVSALLHGLLWSLREECGHSEARGGQPCDPRMEEARLRLEREPEANLSVAALARSLHLSESHFSRRFKRCVGLSPKAYQVRARMRYARFLLEQEQASVQTVAARLGYSDPFVFSRQFRKIWGMPPSAVRR